MQKITEEKKLQVEQLQEWINDQPLYPKNIEENLVVRFLHSNYYDMIKAKTTADVFFTIRASLSEILTNRDLTELSLQKCIKHINLAYYQTSEKRNFWIWQLNDPGMANYDYLQDMKLSYLASDASLIENEDLAEEDNILMDVKDVSIKFLWTFRLSLAKKCVKYQEGALPLRLKGIHLLNAPSIIDKVIGLFRPFMRKDLQEKIHFHRPNSTTLYDHFRKDDLPLDYGGTRPPMKELMTDVVGVIERNRKRLSQDMLWSLSKNEKNKTKPTSASDFVTLRTLAID